ncbi:MAG TPA: LLM class flavin-dependent oxidoreductase [Acidimicrobiales bacterium]|nr:LLM class flavin-dependent oxidoreductase [Acidimicrobiales bacterium]
MKVRFAVAPGPASIDPGGYAELVDGLEAKGFDTIWLSDVPMAGGVLDPVVGLALAAGRTSRLKLGANVVPVGRNPFRLAKELAQLDRLSGGRILLSFVPGLDHPAERESLGSPGDRGRFLDEVIPLVRRWWAGETVEHHSPRFDFPGVALGVSPVQRPLEVWVGGIGPRALTRAGCLADGWLGAAVTAAEAGAARARIEEAAAGAGRTIDPEHFGLSLPYARRQPDAVAYEALRRRRPDVDPAELLPVGRDSLRTTVRALIGEGISKFVVRPSTPVDSWDEELDWLQDAVIDLQA